MKSSNLNYIGSNIRYLRQQRGLTIAELASRIGIKAVPLGRIERCENTPSTSVLYKLSREFNISLDAFFSESIEKLQSYQQKSTTDPIQIKEQDFLGKLPSATRQMVHEIIQSVHSLEDICGIQKHANIPLLIPFIPNRNGIEELSSKVRQYMDIGNSIVFDYFELFESKGLRAISIPLPKETNSFSYFDHINQNAFFFINSKNTPERQIFSLVYELGKVLISSYSIQQAKDLFPDDEDDEFESKPLTAHRAARLFAASFLMPEINIRNTIDRLNINKKKWSYELLLRIKHRYGVSTQALLIRLKELDFINSTAADIYEDKLKSYYEESGYKEPGSSKRILTPNCRLWDLLLIGESIKKENKRINEIREIYSKWKLP